MLTTKGGVGLPVCDVGTPAPVHQLDGALGAGIDPHLPNQAAAAAPDSGLLEELQRRRELDGEHRHRLRQRAAGLPRLNEGSVPPSARQHGLTRVGERPQRTRQRQQLEGQRKVDIVRLHLADQGGARWFVVAGLLDGAELHIGPEAPLHHEEGLARRRIDADLPGSATALLQQLDGPGEAHLIRRELRGDVRADISLREKRPVPPHPDLDRLAVLRLSQRDAAHPAGIDALGGFGEPVLESLVSQVEALEILLGLPLTEGDLVELVLHLRREVVVHQPGEVLLEEHRHGEGGVRGDQRGAPAKRVPPLLHGVDDGSVGRGPTDAPRLQLLDQAGFSETRRRLRDVALRIHPGDRELLALRQRRQDGGVRAGAAVGPAVTEEGQRAATDLQTGVAGAEADVDRLAAGVLHLTGDRAAPDEVVEARLVSTDLDLRLIGASKLRASGTDGLVGLLGALALLCIEAGLAGQVLRAEPLRDERSRRPDGLVRQARGVGTHVGDPAVLVQPLRHPHGAARRPAQPPVALLLQGAGGERGRGAVAVVPLLEIGHGGGALGEGLGDLTGGGLVQDLEVLPTRLELTPIVEVLAHGQSLVLPGDKPGPHVALLGVQIDVEVPPGGRHERQPLPLPLDDEAHRHRLHATRGEPRTDLPPQQRRDLVPIEPIDDPPGLLGPHQVEVDLAGVLEGVTDGGLGDLVEHQPADRHLGLEHLDEMPGDALPLAVLISREVERLTLLQRLLEHLDVGLLVGRDHVERAEPLLHVHAEARPLVLLVRGGDLGGVSGQIPDVTDGGLHPEPVAEEPADRPGLRRGLHDDQGGAHVLSLPAERSLRAAHGCRENSSPAAGCAGSTL